MAEKINISDLKFETYADKSLKVFSQMTAEPDNKLGLGSIAAQEAGNAAALALCAVKMTKPEDEKVLAAAKNLETMREYLVHLMDEENKAKAPLEKRLANGGPEEEIEGGVRTACAIVSEILYSTINVVEIFAAIADKLCPCAAHTAAAAIIAAQCALDTARIQLAWRASQMNEEIYARTTRREPEIAIEGIKPTMDALLQKFEGMIK